MKESRTPLRDESTERIERMRRTWARSLLVAVVIATAVPFAWHLLGLGADGSTDYLAYLGSLLGAVATIVAVVWEIRISNESQRDEYEKSVRPIVWLGIDPDYQVRDASRSDASSDDPEVLLALQENDLAEDLSYDRMTYDSCLVLTRDDGVTGRSHRVKIDETLSLNAHNVTYREGTDGIASHRRGTYQAIPLILKNVGTGPALNLVLGTRLEGEEGDDFVPRPPTVLGVGDAAHFLVCVERSGWDRDETIFIVATYDTLTGQGFRVSCEVLLHVDTESHSITDYHLNYIPELQPIVRQ